MFRDDIEDAQIFFDENLLRKKFVPRMIEAFQKAGPDQAVIVSIVQKKPFFIIRNDRLNVFRAFVANDGLHIRFIKTDAKLTGDYQARVTGTKIADRVKGLRVSLEPQKGQKLGLNDPREIILALEHDFANQVAAQSDQEEPKKGGKKTKTTPTTDSSKSSTERLKELKSLKDQGLITPQEYEEKKKEILSGI